METVINSNNDTLIQIKINDAKIILKDLLDKKYVDSLLVVHENLNTINENIIKLDSEQIKILEQESNNKSIVINNLNENINIKDEMINIKDRSIKKQKFLKYLAFISTITLGILLVTK